MEEVSRSKRVNLHTSVFINKTRQMHPNRLKAKGYIRPYDGKYNTGNRETRTAVFCKEFYNDTWKY